MRVCADMERTFGLYMVPGRPGRGRPGYSRTQIERVRRAGVDLERLRTHLKVLRTAGLIDGERRGTWVYYRIVPSAVARLGALFTPLPSRSRRECKRSSLRGGRYPSLGR